MKSENIVKINNKPRAVKQFNWKDDEIKIEVNAYQFEDDEFNADPEGDVVMQSFKHDHIIEAFRAFLKYIEKGYESVELSIYSYVSEDASFNIRMKPKGITAWSTTDISPSDINAEKLAKIQQIIQS